RSEAALRPEAGLLEAERQARRSRDGEVTLPRIVRAAGDADRFDHLRHHEAHVRVAGPADVRRLVHRDVADEDLDVLPARAVEAAQREVRGPARQAAIAHEDAGE